MGTSASSSRTKLPSAAALRARAIESLAQKMYEASDPDGVSWSRRGRIVREPWLKKAWQRLEEAGDAADRP
jgi:hypothetical protein